jgi:hypothetical protein
MEEANECAAQIVPCCLHGGCAAADHFFYTSARTSVERVRARRTMLMRELLMIGTYKNPPAGECFSAEVPCYRVLNLGGHPYRGAATTETKLMK